MKKKILVTSICLVLGFTADAQGVLLMKLLTSKIIRAMDLRVQQLQNEAIRLQLLQKKIENDATQAGLARIASWQEKQKQLYQAFFDEWTQVKTAVGFSRRISEVVQRQKQVVANTRLAVQQAYADRHYSAAEAAGFAKVCEEVLQESFSNLSVLLQIISTGQLSMNDAQRLEALMQAADHVETQSAQLDHCLQEMRRLSLAREKRNAELNHIKGIYGFR